MIFIFLQASVQSRTMTGYMDGFPSKRSEQTLCLKLEWLGFQTECIFILKEITDGNISISTAIVVNSLFAFCLLMIACALLT